MNPERWAHIKEIFNDALELEPEKRNAFIHDKCGDDKELRREIESLLKSASDEFMERPAVEVAAQLMASARSKSLAGTRLNHYRILSIIGSGGMADVYRAHDEKLNREVALKVLPEAFAGDRDRRSRFHREAQVLASLNHPNIASIYGIEEDANVFALVLELVEGETLGERISRGRVPVSEAFAIGLQIVEGLAAAHAKAIVHRDLKPGNVKVTPEGVVKLLDFGLAKMFGANTPAGLYATPLVSTKPNVILGTVAYMSPEQARGKSLDRRTDIWSFGCVMYELLSGMRAFAGNTPTEILGKITSEDLDWSKLPAETPAAARAVLRRCLQKDPNQRLHRIEDAREALSIPKTGNWFRQFVAALLRR